MYENVKQRYVRECGYEREICESEKNETVRG